MAVSRNPAKRGRLGLSIVECTLALAVMCGLGFVSLRIMAMGPPAGPSASATQTADTVTIMMKAETAPSTKTP